MAQKKNPALGKGLGAIFGSDVEKYLDDIQTNSAEAPGRREIEIPVKEIRPNPYQPRKEFDKKEDFMDNYLEYISFSASPGPSLDIILIIFF